MSVSFDFATSEARVKALETLKPGTPRGKALEQLVSEMFAALPGVEVVNRNVLAGFGEAELDIQFLNRQLDGGLPVFGRDVFVECKTSGEPLNSAGVSHFGVGVSNRHLEWAIIVSLEGITGDKDVANAAQRTVVDFALRGTWLMVIDGRELRAPTSPEHLAAIIERKRQVQVAKRTAVALSDSELRALNPSRVTFRRGSAAIEQAIRDARNNVLGENFAAATALPDTDDAGALAAADHALSGLNQVIVAREEDPEEDPLWLMTRSALIDFAATLVRVLEHTFEEEIDATKAIAFEVNYTAPQRLGAHVGSHLWRLLVEHHMELLREEPAWRPRRSAYALISMVVEEVIAIDSIDPADLLGYDEYDEYNQF